MAKIHTVAVLVGSLRKESFNRKVARALVELAPPELTCRFVEIGHLGLYNQDLDADFPPAWNAFKEEIKTADAVLFVTPEYNRGIPGVLKNAIDIGSRPFGKSCWTGKPACVVSASPGAAGGISSHHHLRQSLVALGMATMPQPEVFIGAIDKKIGADGKIADEGTKKLLALTMQSFAAWIGKNVN